MKRTNSPTFLTLFKSTDCNNLELVGSELKGDTQTDK
jgi:hypothetical protein